MKKILIVEDEYHIRHIISEYFNYKGVEVIECMNGHDALTKMDKNVELVLLDIMMPGINGYEVCSRLKEHYSIPIIFISALSQEENQLKAYELGGDDYVTKPFSISVLYAKCQAILNRVNQKSIPVKEYGRIKIDTQAHQVIIDQVAISMTPKEYDLLVYLCKHQNHVISRELLLEKVWGYDYYDDKRAVDNYIKKIRKKIEPYSFYIQTVTKVGYMFKVVEK